eukprot:1651841-Alexandrium_andersonii.AAC.1
MAEALLVCSIRAGATRVESVLLAIGGYSACSIRPEACGIGSIDPIHFSVRSVLGVGSGGSRPPTTNHQQRT